MLVPKTNYHPPCRISRVSHAVFTSRDIGRAKAFYTEVLGLVVSDEDGDTLYLRGLEERGHHSLVFHRAETASCIRLGMRVFDDDELELTKRAFDAEGLPTQWVERPFQERTLHCTDVVGTPLEIVATMARQPRRDMQVNLHKGAAARRFDHYQITVPDVAKAGRFYAGLGFRIADYLVAGDHPIGVFLHVKDTPYDIVFLERDGPAFHHFGYIVSDVQSLLRACDTMGELGWGGNVEYGPGKHGVGHSYYVYVRDPDGHRVELLLPPILHMDGDDEPAVWDILVEKNLTEAWGLPARASWFAERTPFQDCPTSAPPVLGSPMTLERFLGVRD